MRVIAPFVLCSLLVALPAAAQSQFPPPASQKVDYDKDVKPLLAENCYSCHGATAEQSRPATGSPAERAARR